MTRVMVTEREAAQVVAAIRAEFGAEGALIGPVVFPGPHEGLPGRCKVIWWEEGPFEWAILATGGGVEEEMTGLVRALAGEFDAPGAARATVTRQPVQLPPGVWAEPVNGCCLGLYPKEA